MEAQRGHSTMDCNEFLRNSLLQMNLESPPPAIDFPFSISVANPSDSGVGFATMPASVWLLAVACLTWIESFKVDGANTTLALIGIVAESSGTIDQSIGSVTKSLRNPLFVGTEWQRQGINNGYPTVIYDPTGKREHTLDVTNLKVHYSNRILIGPNPNPSPNPDPLGKYRCWYDMHEKASLAYANSSDGLQWEKVDVPGRRPPERNLVYKGNGLGVYKDPTMAPGSPSRFKAIGNLGGGPGAGVGGSHSLPR